MHTDLVKNHVALVLLVDYKNCNPGGDPDRDNTPRVDDETGHGLIMHVTPKRKIRDWLALQGHGIYVSRGACYETDRNKPIYSELGITPPPVESTETDEDEAGDDVPVAKKAKGGKKGPKAKPPSAEQAVKIYRAINGKYLDARWFGQPVPGCPGTNRGPIQFSNGESIDPVSPLRNSITRCAVATEKEALDQNGANHTFGGVHYIPYGLYRFHIYVNPSDARDTKLTEGDYDLFITALMSMFDHDRASGRAQSCIRALYEFKFPEKRQGPVNVERLLESVQVKRKDPERAARSFDDYTVTIPNKVQNHKDFAFKRLVSEVNPYLDEVAAE